MRRIILTSCAVAAVALLAGCAMALAAPPDFKVPVKWEGGRGDFGAPEYDMSLTLRSDGVAELEQVPGGQWVQTDDGICWDDTDELYTGEGTWRVFNARGVEVSFDDSNVIFWAWPGKFGTYGWRELKMIACGAEYKMWGMALECGEAGGMVLSPCPDPS